MVCIAGAMYKAPIWLFLSLLILSTCTLSFDLTRMCETRCMYGMGGNLCHCSASHFAGKRSEKDMPLRVFDLGLEAWKYRNRNFDDDNTRISASASWSAQDIKTRMHDAEDEGQEDVMKRLFDREGDEKSEIRRLSLLLKAAVDGRLIGLKGTTREWRRQSAFPYDTDDNNVF